MNKPDVLDNIDHGDNWRIISSVPNRSCWPGCGSMWSVSLPHFRGTPCSFFHLNRWFGLIGFIMMIIIFVLPTWVNSKFPPSSQYLFFFIIDFFFFLFSLISFFFQALQFLDFWPSRLSINRNGPNRLGPSRHSRSRSDSTWSAVDQSVGVLPRWILTSPGLDRESTSSFVQGGHHGFVSSGLDALQTLAPWSSSRNNPHPSAIGDGVEGGERSSHPTDSTGWNSNETNQWGWKFERIETKKVTKKKRGKIERKL